MKLTKLQALLVAVGALPPSHFLRGQIDAAREREIEDLKRRLRATATDAPPESIVPPATLEALKREMQIAVATPCRAPKLAPIHHTRRSPASEARRQKNRAARKARRKNRRRS